MITRIIAITGYLHRLGVLIMKCDYCGLEAIKCDSTSCACPRCDNLFTTLLTHPDLIKLGEQLKKEKTNVIRFPTQLRRVK